MYKFKLFFLTVLSVIASSSIASTNEFFDEEKIIACGTIISMRPLNQFPLPSKDLQLHAEVFSAKMNSSGNFAQLFGNGLISAAGAIVGSFLFDATADAIKGPPSMASIPGEIYGAKIFAVKIKLDDGREINLPLVQRRKAYFHDLLEVGQRNPLSYSVEHNVIMVGNVMHTPPLPGDKNYDSACGLRIDKDRADSIIESSESLVNERMIIQE